MFFLEVHVLEQVISLQYRHSAPPVLEDPSLFFNLVLNAQIIIVIDQHLDLSHAVVFPQLQV